MALTILFSRAAHIIPTCTSETDRNSAKPNTLFPTAGLEPACFRNAELKPTAELST